MIKKILAGISLVLLSSFATAKTVAYIAKPEIGVLLLEDEECREGGQKAILTDVADKRYEGCYVLYEEYVYILWDDGDKDRIPAAYFQFPL